MSLGVSYTTLLERDQALGRGRRRRSGRRNYGPGYPRDQDRYPGAAARARGGRDGSPERSASAGGSGPSTSASTPIPGSMVEAMGHVDWYFARNFGIGGGYEYSKIDVKRETDTKTTEFDFRYDGPLSLFHRDVLGRRSPSAPVGASRPSGTRVNPANVGRFEAVLRPLLPARGSVSPHRARTGERVVHDARQPPAGSERLVVDARALVASRAVRRIAIT